MAELVPYTSPRLPVPAEARLDAIWIDAYLDQQQSEIRRYLNIVAKRKLLVGAIMIGVWTAVGIRTYTAERVYSASANIQIDPEQTILPYKTAAPIIPDPRYLNTQAQVLKSEALARRAVVALELTRDPEGSASLARWFAGNVTVLPIEGTQVVKVTYRSDDPDFAARAVNVLADEYIKYGFEIRRDASGVARDFLQAELTRVASKLQQSEQRMVDYARTHDILLPSREDNIIVRKLTELNDELTRVEAQVRANQYESLRNTPLESVPEKLRTPVTRELDSRRADLEIKLAAAALKFGPKWPEVIALQQDLEKVRAQFGVEKEKALSQARVEYDLAVAHRTRLTEAVAEQQRLADQLLQASIGYDILKREADTDRQIHEGLLQRLRETDVSAGLKAANVHVIDRGHVPQLPTSPNVPLSVGLGLIAGIVCGVAAATAVEIFDRRLRTPEDVERELRVPFLGTIPAFDAAWREAAGGFLVPMTAGPLPRLVPAPKTSAGYWESYRALRTSLLFSPADRPGTILVTSALADEGKTTTAVNFAITLAQTGARTVILELDMRRPRLAERLAVEADRGMSRYLSGQTQLYGEIQETSAPNLYVVAAGPIPPNPAELLGSVRMTRALLLLRRHFDYVIVDGPPVMPLTDALVIASQVDGVVLVVNGRTSKDTAARARALLKGVDARMLGAVINNVKVEPGPAYTPRDVDIEVTQEPRGTSVARVSS